MDYRVMLLLVHFGFSFSLRSDLFHREYYYVNISMKWTDAQRYCREKHTDLATFDSMDDILKLNRPSFLTPYTWIGLWDDPRAWKEGTVNDDNSWKWSSTGKSLTGFSKWAKNQPNFYNAREKCAMFDTAGNWFDSFCSHQKSFVCYTESTPPGQKTYTFISIVTTWDKAQSYCRTHHTDLALIKNDLENMSALKHQSGFVWIGLRREPWVWSDGSNSSFTNWNTGQPDNSGYNDLCVVELDDHKWEDAPCIKEFVFLCYEDHLKKKVNTTRMKMQSDADLSDPAINEQILKQIKAQLSHNGVTGVKVNWKIQPQKVEKDQQDAETDEIHCNP